MTAFLWTFVLIVLVNIVATIISAYLGGISSPNPWTRVFDALLTFGLGCWALWLLAMEKQ